MKKILFLLLSTCSMYGQIVPTGQEQDFDYGIKNTASQLDDNAVFITVQNSDGVQGKSTSSVWAKKIYVDNADVKKAFLSTGLIKNGLVQANADPTKFNITAGIGIISNFDDPENPTSTIVNFPAFIGITPTYLTTSNITYIAINSSAAIVQQATPFTNVQRRDLIALGAVIHSNLTTINLINNISAPTNADTNQLHDLMEAIGALNVDGNKIVANNANLSINKTAGDIFKLGVNFANDWKNPHKLNLPLQTVATFRYRTQNGTEGGNVTVLNPALYDVANVLTSVPSNKFSIQTVTLFQTGAIRVQYGQATYATLSEAEAAIMTRTYNVEPNIAANGITRAYIILKNTATSLQNASDTKIVEAGKFGNVGGSGGAITLDAIVAALGYTPANNVDLSLKSDKINFINIKDLGGNGNGIFDNTTIINNALSIYDEVYFPDGNYLVTSLVNTKGSNIKGEGNIVKTVPFGKQLLNTEADKYQYIFGTEYLSHLHKELIAGNTTTATLSGNSTTYGDATTAPFHLDAILGDLCDKNGIEGVTWVNAGHSGAGSNQWLSTDLAVDMAGNPDLYIIDWAINDGGFSTDPIAAADLHVANIKIGLQRIRGVEFGKTLAEMSIVLTSPNATTDDSFNHKSELFNERVASGLKELAREFNCVFINKFAFFKDCRHEEHMEKYDLGGGNFTYIHPLNVMNTWITSIYFDAIFPLYYRTNGIENNAPALPNGSVLFSKIPTAFKNGISLDYSGADSGFPFLGTVTTIKQKSGTTLQFLSDYDSGASKISLRTGFLGTWQGFTSLVTGSGSFSTSTETKLNSDAVSTYVIGESIHFVTTANGFPINGTLVTHQTTLAGVSNQILTTYDGGVSIMYVRSGWVVGGWMEWQLIENASNKDNGTLTTSTTTYPTSGAVKMVTDANATAIALKSNISSPSFTGTPTAPTATAGTNTTQIATTAFVLANTGTSGTYTPTFTNTTNITSSTLNQATYTRIGNIISVTIGLLIDVTTTGTNSKLTLTLPTNTVDTTQTGIGIGNITTTGAALNAAGIVNVVSASTAEFVFYPTGNGSAQCSIQYQYNLN